MKNPEEPEAVEPKPAAELERSLALGIVLNDAWFEEPREGCEFDETDESQGVIVVVPVGKHTGNCDTVAPVILKEEFVVVPPLLAVATKH